MFIESRCIEFHESRAKRLVQNDICMKLSHCEYSLNIFFVYLMYEECDSYIVIKKNMI